MDADLRSEQIAFYRAHAPHYDADAYGRSEALELVAHAVELVPVGGDLLEIACGTGMWTQHLVGRADSVTAIDSAPEMIEIARTRAQRASFVCIDVLDWTPPKRFDTIFFGFWLSHVPPELFDVFWRTVARGLAPDGRVVFVDEHISAADKETWLGDDVVQRRLADGSTHRIVKTYLDPGPLTRRLNGLGWQVEMPIVNDLFVAAIAQRSEAPVEL